MSLRRDFRPAQQIDGARYAQRSHHVGKVYQEITRLIAAGPMLAVWLGVGDKLVRPVVGV